MTDTYIPGIAEPFRIISRYPKFAVSVSGKVLNLNTGQLLVVDEEGLAEIIREESSDRLRIVELDVQYWVDKLFGDV